MTIHDDDLLVNGDDSGCRVNPVERAHEIRAWIALMTGYYHGVIAAAHAGADAAPHHSVAIQLFAQEAKAWAPMRQAEARITLGVVAARQGDLEAAINQGERALSAPRKSLPSLLMVSRDLTRVLNDQYPSEPQTRAYLDQIHALSSLTSGQHVPAVR